MTFLSSGKLFPLATLLLLVGLLFSASLSAQVDVETPRVTVLPVENATGRGQYDGAAVTVTDTIPLTLELIGEYELLSLSTDRLPTTITPESVGELAATEGIDNVIFGEIRLGSRGEIIFDMSLYDRSAGEVTFREQWVAERLLDVFSTTDLLVQEFVSNFSGIRIGFGSVQFVPSRSDVDYRVFVDRTFAGRNVEELAQILIGERTVEVRQQGFSGESVIVEEEVTVDEGGRTTFDLEFLDVIESDRAYVSALRGAIERNLPHPQDLEVVRSSMEELDAFFREYPEVLQGEQDRHEYDQLRLDLAQDYNRIVARRYLRNGEFAVGEEEIDELLGRSVEFLEREEDETDIDQQVTAEAERNVAALYELSLLGSAYYLSAEQYARVYTPFTAVTHITSRTRLPYRYFGLRTRTRSAVLEYQRLDERRRPFWHWLVGMTGAGAAGYGGYLYATDAPGQALDDTRTFEDAYNAATDVDEVVVLRDEIDSGYDKANFLGTVQWSSLGTGAGLLTTAIVSRAITVGRPERRAERFARQNYPIAMVAAEQAYGREYAPGEAGLLVFNRGRSVGSGDVVQGTPWFSEREAGETVTIRGGSFLGLLDDDPRTDAPMQVTLHEGLNVVVMEQ